MKREDTLQAFNAVGLVALHLLLILVFYIAVTPIALLLRLLRMDVVGIHRDTRRASYWRGRRS